MGCFKNCLQPADKWVVFKLVSSLQGLQTVTEFPELGTVLPVNLHKPITRADTTKRLKFLPKDQVDVEPPMPELPAVGAWVKLRNLRAVAVDGQLQVRMSILQGRSR